MLKIFVPGFLWIASATVWASEPGPLPSLFTQGQVLASACSRAVEPPARWSLQALIRWLPAKWRTSLLARRAEMRSARLVQLQNEIAALVPPEAAAFMAFMPQTSHSYLLLELPDLDRKGRLLIESTSLQRSAAAQEVKEDLWKKRLGTAIVKMEEMLTLLGLEPESDDVLVQKALSHLSMGMALGFSYGFEHGIKCGAESWTECHPVAHQDQSGFALRATSHFGTALAMLGELQANPDAITWAQFLFARHAVNTALVFSNSGVYTIDWKPIPPDAQSKKHFDIALDLLPKVIAATKDRLTDGSGVPTPFFQLHFESRYHLTRLPSMLLEDRGADQGNKRMELLRDFVRLARDLDVRVDTRTRYGIVPRLVNEIRWDHQDRMGGKALFDLEKRLRLGAISKSELIEALVGSRVFSASDFE